MRAAVAVLALALAACTTAPAVSFDADRALAHVRYLGDPARGGRLSGSPQFDEAARYVADQFREIGLEPLGDGGSYLQRFSMPIVGLTAMPSLEMTAPATRTFSVRQDFNEYVSGRAGGGAADALISVVGAADRDDFTGANVSGRITLVTNTSKGNPVEQSFQRGAVGVLIVAPHPEIRFSYLPFLETTTIPVLQISDALADALLAASGRHLADLRDAVDRRHADAGLPPTGVDLTTRVRMSVPLGALHNADAANVVGLLRAPDASGATRAVLVGGHLDGLGTDPDGTVFPGANDNASGVAIVIEAARALAAKRSSLTHSIVFVAFGGEEEGYLGSAAYIQMMSASPGRVESLIAMLNTDAAGCCGTKLGASAEDAGLQARVRAAIERSGIPYAAVSGGSDHQSFARAHVPAVLVQWDDLVLHVPGDTVSRIDAAHLRGPGQVIASVAFDLATQR